MKRRLAIFIVLTMSAPVTAQWLDLKTPGLPRTDEGRVDLSAPVPRNADGRPNLSGLWVPREVSGDFLNSENVQEWAQQRMEASEENFFADSPRFNCLPSGPGSYPAGAAYGGMRRFVHGPGIIAVLNSDLTYRQIFLDGRELEAEPFPTWTGYSVGHWDGDTLVVESNGYNDRTWLHGEGLPHTENLRITERYRRTAFGHMQLDITYDDPGTFHSPVNATIALRFAADTELLEVVCNESSKGTSHYNGEISEAVQKIVEVPEDVLATYVGTYQGRWLGNPITAEVTLEDGALHLERTPPYSDAEDAASLKLRLIAQSQNAFDCPCGLGFIFSAEEDGMTTELLEVHVSGAWTFRRVP